MVQAKIRDTVKVHYTGRLDDGSTFDTSMHRDPLEFILGDGELIPGFEKAVLGMNPGDSKTATIPAEQAYGAHRPEMVIEVDRQHLPPTLQPYVGQRLQMTQQDGTPVPVLIMAVMDAQVTLDANHPLAGKDLIPRQPCKQPQRPYPSPSCGAYPAPAKAALQRAPPGSGALRRAAAAGGGRGKRHGREWPQARAGGQGGGAKKEVWISYTLGSERPHLISAGSVNSALYGYYPLQGGSSSWDSP
jgi:peptidylprolyl isomerase